MTTNDDRKDDDLPAQRHEHVRAGYAFAITFPIAMVAVIVIAQVSDPPGSLVSGLLFWDLFGIAYAWLTLRVFGGSSHERLGALVAHRHQSRLRRVLSGGSDGPGFSVQFAAAALGSAALLPRVDRFAPADGEGVLLSVLIVLAVAMAIVVVTLSYAVHYARLDVAQRGIGFPGTDRPVFTDYLYLATSVATTFGTTDVTVESTRLRKTIMGHSALTLLFNSVTIALLVSALA